MAIESTEYDLESFLDEYRPLCCKEYKEKPKRFSEFRKNWLSDIPLTNHPLSYLKRERHVVKRNDHEAIKLSKRTVNTEKKIENKKTFGRRDSGYSSHSSSKMKEYKQKNKKKKPVETNTEKDNENHITSSDQMNSSLIEDFKEKHTKMQTIKKKISKQYFSKNLDSENETGNIKKHNNVWKKAKTQAAKIKIKLNRKNIESIHEEVSPLISPTMIKRDTKRINNTKHISRQSSKSRQNSFTRNTFERNSYTGKKKVPSLKHQFADNFTLPRVTQTTVYNKVTSRQRPRSLYSKHLQSLLSINIPSEHISSTEKLFDEKYLNQSLSHSNLFELEDDIDENHEFFNDDFINEYEETAHEFTNQLFASYDLDHYNEDEDRFDNDLVQNEVENYYEAADEPVNIVKRIRDSTAFSYSVNNLYDLCNDKDDVTQQSFNNTVF